MDIIELSALIDECYENHSLFENTKYAAAVHGTIDLLDKGQIRVAEKRQSEWTLTLSDKLASKLNLKRYY